MNKEPSAVCESAQCETTQFQSFLNRIQSSPVVTPDVIDGNVQADKYLRVQIDGALQQLKSLPPSRERSLSITKLQEAVMWLGMDLKRLNEPNPYPNSYKPENATVEPTADGLKL